MKHVNDGHCVRCREIVNRYPYLHYPLYQWFFDLQQKHPEAHISCAGRGEIEQDMLYYKKATRALYGQSAHNWNAAIDVFEIGGKLDDIYERAWFDKVIAPNLPDWLIWYGSPGAKFPELPHIEVKGWKDLAKLGRLFLTEEDEHADIKTGS